MTRTIRYLDDGSIELVEKTVPDPGPGEVQLQGGACGICSWDVATAKFGREMHPMAPPGHEGVGYVAKLGPGVNSAPASKIRQTFGPAVRLIHEGIIDHQPLVTHVATLEDYPTLMKQIFKGDESYLKGVVTLP